MSISDVVAAGQPGATVSLSNAGLERIEQSNQVVLTAAAQRHKIYGITVGLGPNHKRRMIDEDGRFDESTRQRSVAFNKALVYAHNASVGEPMDQDVVRMAMALRVNQYASGKIGVDADIPKLFVEFLNRGITPVVPIEGSVSTADILPGAYLVLAIMGESDVYYKGKVVPALEAMRAEGLKPVEPFGKDALSTFCNNALSVAYSIKIADRTRTTLDATAGVVAMSLEAINGNVSPYLQHTLDNRPMPYVKQVAADITGQLDGSYLWDVNADRTVQDALVFRGAHWPIAAAYHELEGLDALLALHINNSDDNPTVIIDVNDVKVQNPESSQVRSYITTGDVTGAVQSSSNFEATQISIRLSGGALAMGHVARDSVYRTLNMADPNFTKLPAFLNEPDTVFHGFMALQKLPVSLFMQVKNNVMPVSLDSLPMAGGYDNTGSNMMFANQRMDKALDDIEQIFGVEMMMGAQAVDMRIRAGNDKMGAGTSKLHQQIRQQVAYLDKDRPLADDVVALKGIFQTLKF
ncbi:aromatic amino acid ammonia-lyase [Ferrimonas senticii]|uniref:aromatic amino acid ammonia-lyase n=1 Tax=Ferrimonas senticii TaxID=394566 RepID=UPI0004895239|nr:aromatic amino acid ammonia-lyase [Ferrimonas senticii]